MSERVYQFTALALARSCTRFSRSATVNLLMQALPRGSIALLRLGIEPHRQPGFRHIFLGFPHAMFAKMEDRGRQDRRGVTFPNTLDHVVERADTAGSYNRHRDGVGDRAGERDVIAFPGSVAVHRREQDFAGAKRDDLPGIVDRIEAGRLSSAMREDFPAVLFTRACDFLGVDRDDNALVAEFSAASFTKARRSTAAVLIDTLSAPHVNNFRISSTERTPPPTVSGMKQASAVRVTTS